MKPIFVSIVLCTYNDETYIAKSVQSILEQTYPYFELIIVNDGSTDNTLEIISSFNDSRITIIDKMNTGLPDSLNYGISVAKYEWIVRMDGDDISEPNRLEVQLNNINSNSNLIGSCATIIDSCDNILGEKIVPISSKDINRWLFWGNSPIIHPTAIIRKSVVQLVGGYDVNFKSAQDLDLWYRISRVGGICNDPNKLLKFRQHKNSISNSRKIQQRKYAVVAFTKFSLKCDVLTSESFELLLNLLEERFHLSFIIEKLNNAQRKGFFYRKSIVMFYYIWRLFLFGNLIINSRKYKKQIGLL